jgi:hypothetical protein
MKKLTFTLLLACALISGVVSATSLAASPIKVSHLVVSAKLKTDLKSAFSRSHHLSLKKAPAATSVKAIHYGPTDYAIASFKHFSSPELFSRSAPTPVKKNGGVWVDKGSLKSKACKIPVAVVNAFGIRVKCGATPPPITTTTTTPTTTTDTTPPVSTTPTLPPPSPNPAQPPSKTDIDLVVLNVAAQASNGSCNVLYTAQNGKTAYTKSTAPSSTSEVSVVSPSGKSATANDVVDIMGGGASWSRSVSVPLDCSKSGNYLITVKLDYQNQIGESNEDNNNVQVVTDPSTSAFADLAVTDVGLHNCNEAFVTITNNGNAANPAEPSDVNIDVSGGNEGTNNFDLPSLAPGQSQTFTTSYSGSCSGVYAVGGVDPYKLFVDSDRSNNGLVVKL